MKVDGSYSHQTGRAGYGISDRYTKQYGTITARNHVECELMAIVIGCQLVEHGGTIKSDAQHLVRRLVKNKKVRHHCFYSEYALELIKDKNIKLKWINRKYNRAADRLAKRAIKYERQI